MYQKVHLFRSNSFTVVIRKFVLSLYLVLWVLFCSVRSLWATPTGLNNIPTADVPPHKTLVFQEYSTFGDDHRPTHSVGFKTGVFDWMELGWDRSVGPGPSEANLFQMKLRYDPKEEMWPTLAAGVANVAFSSRGRRISGQPFPYLVTSWDFKWARVHVGGDFQNDNEGVFAGLDKEILKGLTFRTDAITIHDREDVLFSVGGIYVPGWKFPFNVAFEGWYSVATDSGTEDFFLLKANYVLNF